MYEAVNFLAQRPLSLAPSAPYDRLADVYDLLAAIYTGGGIRRAQCQHVGTLRPGQRVLYVGSGTGYECAQAAQQGADVTIAELSLTMLNRCKKRFKKLKRSGTFLHANALNLHDKDGFDVVVAPFFLNTLDRKGVTSALSHLCHLLRPGGRLICVDFRAPQSSWAFRKLQEFFYLPPLILFRLLAANPWHEIYDYEAMSRSTPVPLTLLDRKSTRAWGLELLETITWQAHTPFRF